MKTKILALSLLYFALCSFSSSLNASDFEQFPSEESTNNYVSEIDFKGHDNLKMFADDLNAQLSDGPNFAGNYLVAYLGCGTACQSNVVIDLRSGAILQNIVSCEGSEYQLESRLLIINPVTEDNPDPMCETARYELKNGNISEI